jgi:PAS domain S-box-containing protein
MLGFSEEELQGKDLNELTHPIDLELTREVYQQLFAGVVDHYQVEKRYIRKDGEVIWVHLIISLVRDEQGAPRFAVKMIEDISARKQMEAELAEVQHRLLDSREHERTRLAQELHDDPMQDLYGVLYQLNDFDEVLKEEEYILQMRGVRQSVQQVINTLRSICGELRSPTLAPFGLEGAIREHVEQFQEKHAQIKVTLDLMYDGSMLSEDLRLNLFRIYQQAMNNVVRHANATQISVSFLWDEEKIFLEVEDNGRGFEVPSRWISLAREGHLGLIGAAERAELMGGQLKVDSQPGKGTKIKVMLPRNQVNMKSGLAIRG